MKFLVSPVTQEQLDDCGDEGLFKGTDGYMYNYMIAFNEDEYSDVVITDNVGRVMPICIDDVPAIQKMLERIAYYTKQQNLAKEFNIAQLLNGASI